MKGGMMKTFDDLLDDLLDDFADKHLAYVLSGQRTKAVTKDTVLAEVKRMVLAEREACAKICEEDESGRDSGGYFADIIRCQL